jgi:uncharacterized protein YjhX (UPF0386 family)
MAISDHQQRLLESVAQGDVLKVHRSMDGEKQFRLHALDGSAVQVVSSEDVELLMRLGLVGSNMKFPAATFLLTEAGAQRVRRQTGTAKKCNPQLP